MSTPNLQNLGKYIIMETLGKGAMGVVYKGFDPHIKRTVAIKTIRRELLEADQAASLVARFKNEAQAAGRLSHPGIVGVYEYGEQNTLTYIVMEYIQGNGLDEYFKRGVRFGPTDMVSIMAQLLDALDHAHDQGIVHRDIKPSNIIVMLNGRLKLADFGIARIETSDLTQFGVIMGTPSYIAPEQYLGLTLDRRADIFSAGVIFYQLLTGKKPFSGTAEVIAYKVCHETPPVPSSVEAGGLRQFDAVTLKALARRPEERFQTAQEFREALLKAYRAPATPAVSEQTLIYETTRLTAPGEATSPSRPLGTPSPTGTTGYPPHWDAMILQQVEKHLTRLVGPVARVMVKKAAKTTTDVDSLYRVLADEVGNVQDKTQFLATRRLITGAAAVSAGTHPPTTKSGTQEADVPVVRVTPEAMEQAARRLATYVGPIAKVLAKKAAAQAKDPRQFYLLLADNIGAESDRSHFLRDVGFAG